MTSRAEKTVEVTSVTATIHPASRSARAVLAAVGTALRDLEHVPVSAHETLIEMPGLGTVRVTERADALILHHATEGMSAHGVRQAISHQIRHAAGSRAAAAKLLITWTETARHPSSVLATTNG